MGDGRSPWVLAYDVVDDRRRARLAKFLETQGHRVQDSVFELLATADELAAVLKGAQRHERFDAVTDSLRVYPLCANCLGRAKVLGAGAKVLSPGSPVVL